MTVLINTDYAVTDPALPQGSRLAGATGLSAVTGLRWACTPRPMRVRPVVLAGDERAHYDPAPRTVTPSRDGAGEGDNADRASERLGRLRIAVDQLAELGPLDPESDVEGAELDRVRDELRAEVGLLERLGGLATTMLADTVNALSKTGAIEADGAPSTTEWVKANTGRSGRDAARLSRLATDLADLPATRDGLASGDISAESADAVVRAARDGRLGSPAEVDAELADVARNSSPEKLRAVIRDRQQAADGDTMVNDENRQHARRKTRLWRKKTGMWGLSGELPDEVGQTVRTALDAFDHADPKDTPPEAKRRPEQRLADALAAVTSAVLDRGLTPATGGIVRPHLSVIVDASTVSVDLTRPDAADPHDPAAAPAPDDPRWADLPTGEYPWGGKLSPQAVRRICCDASVSRIVMAGDSQVLDVGRATREWSAPQRRAVNARDRGCRGPNCTRPIGWTSIHHLVWWRNDGPTSVDNGLALCHHCHRLVHDRAWTVALDLQTAEATWTSPTGHIIVTTPAHHDNRATSPTADPGTDQTTPVGADPGSGVPRACLQDLLTDVDADLTASAPDRDEPAPAPAPESTSAFPTATTSGGMPRP